MITRRWTACDDGESRLILDGAASHAPIFGRHDHIAINDRKQRQLAYCLEEVCVLKEALKDLTGSTRIAFTAEQRRRLAIKGKDLSPKERKECCQIVRPETILAWFRQLAARK